MTENASVTDIAVAWVQTLQARGVRLRARGKQLAMMPKQAFGLMSADERQTLKQHKLAIVAVVQEGKYAPAALEPQAAAPPAAPCPHCYKAPCIGEQDERYDLLHPLTERQIFERGQTQLKKDIHERRMRQQFGLPPTASWDR